MRAADLLRKLPAAFDASSAEGADCTIQFDCSTPMHAVIRDGTCRVVDGAASGPDLTVAMEDGDLVALLKGELDGMQAFMTGRLRIDGDMLLAQRLTGFFDASKLV